MICTFMFRLVTLVSLACLYLLVTRVILDNKQHLTHLNDTSTQMGHSEPNLLSMRRHDKAKDNQYGIKKRFPAFLIIGVQKCGTQALATFLDIHPYLHRTNLSEVHFFDRRLANNATSDWYLSVMPAIPRSHMSYEKTPAYFDMADPKDIYNLNKDIKLIVVLCDPVNRSMSAFVHGSQHGKFPNNSNFGDVAFSKQGKINATCDVIERGLYVNYVKRYLKYFPLEQMLFLDKTKFIQDPFTNLEKVETFLNIPHLNFTRELYFNSTQGVYCINPTSKNLEKINKGRTKKPIIDSNGCFDERKHRVHPEFSPVHENRLKLFYKPYNTELAHITGVNFTWISEENK